MVNVKIEIPDEFLKEETRCSYTISKEKKKFGLLNLIY